MSRDRRNTEAGDLQQTRLSAFALGQLDAAERAEFEAELQSNGELRAASNELRCMVDLMREDPDSMPATSLELRETVLQRLDALESAPSSKLAALPRKEVARSRRLTWAVSAVSACLMVIMAGVVYRAQRLELAQQSAPPAVIAPTDVPTRMKSDDAIGRSTEAATAGEEGGGVEIHTKEQMKLDEMAVQVEFLRAELAQAQIEQDARMKQVAELAARQTKLTGQGRRNPSYVVQGARGGGNASSSVVRFDKGSAALIANDSKHYGYAGNEKGIAGAQAYSPAAPGQPVAPITTAPRGTTRGEARLAAGAPYGAPGVVTGGASMGGMGMPARGDYGGSSGMAGMPADAGLGQGGAVGGYPSTSGYAIGGELGGYPGMAGSQDTARMGMGGPPEMDMYAGHSGDRSRWYEPDGGGWRYRGRSIRPTAPRSPNTEQYEVIFENNFDSVSSRPLSTFSIDVDTASYANVRRFLTQSRMPPPNAVRIEELVNYFTYEAPEPADQDPFSVAIEVADCPWQPGNRLVRVGLNGREIPRSERPSCNLVFLLDVSGSMKDSNKLPLLQQAMKLLAGQLTEDDRVAIVTYANQAAVHLDSTTGDRHAEIRDAIDTLKADGSTNGSAGIELAYAQATANRLVEGTNRVILATDGDLNVGVTQDDALVKLITEQAKSGVFLTVLGFGEGNLKDSKLEKLADHGNGMYGYVDSLREARKLLVEQTEGSLVTIAKDVKLKAEFNPAEVQSYRLIGYENRLMRAAEFDDDQKDAGEIGAGHAVTALYEIVPTRPNRPAVATTLKYQNTVQPVGEEDGLTTAARSGELLTLFLRYKLPESDESTLREYVLKNAKRTFDEATDDFRFAASVASFGMLLRQSKHRGKATFADVERIASGAIGDDKQGYRTEFLDLVRRAGSLAK